MSLAPAGFEAAPDFAPPLFSTSTTVRVDQYDLMLQQTNGLTPVPLNTGTCTDSGSDSHSTRSLSRMPDAVDIRLRISISVIALYCALFVRQGAAVAAVAVPPRSPCHEGELISITQDCVWSASGAPTTVSGVLQHGPGPPALVLDSMGASSSTTAGGQGNTWHNVTFNI